MQKNQTIRRLTESSLIAAAYAMLTIALGYFSFGPIQLRVSEALTILPVFTASAIPGLAVGCVISNTIGLLMGTNVAGALDILLGSAATLLAALLSYWLRNVRVAKLPVLSTLPPVVLNAFVVGAELSVVLRVPFWETAAYVGAGQALACIGIGLPLAFFLQKSGAAKRLLS